jgi:hypothetical protein
MVDAVNAGMSIPDAGMLAGYHSRTNADDAYREIRRQMILDLAKHGVGTDALAIKLKEKLDAKETRLFSKDGIITDAVDLEAHGIQLKAVELVTDILGLRDSGNSGASVGAINILCHSGAMPAWAGIPGSNSANGVLTSIPVIPESKLSDRVPISTVEGTGPDPGLPAHKHSKKSASPSVLTRSRKPKRRGK